MRAGFRGHRAVLGVTAVAVGLAAGASPAVAASGHGQSAASTKAAQARRFAIKALEGHQLVRHARGVKGAPTQKASYNWSGYADDNSGGNTYTAVKGTWVEPTVTCNSNEDQIAAFWVGLDGWTSSTVEQDGTLTECYQGTLYQYTWWEMYPTNSIQVVGSTVQPGDKITASVTFASGKYHLKVTDATNTANSFSRTETCATGLTCANSSAEWIGEAPSGARGEYPLEQFTPWKVTGASATSGSAGAISAYPDDQIQMVDSSDAYALAQPGSLSTAGNSFTDTWHDSY